MMDYEMNVEVQRIAQSVVRTGESLLWSGQPDPRRIALQTLPIFILAIPWTAFALFWIATASGFKLPSFDPSNYFSLFPFFGVPFVLIGLTTLALPYWAYRRANRTVYAVTDQRCLMITTGKRMYVDSYAAEDIGAIKRVERRNGTGDLIFAASATDAAKDLTRIRKTGFYGIPNVRLVEDIVRSVFKK